MAKQLNFKAKSLIRHFLNIFMFLDIKEIDFKINKIIAQKIDAKVEA